MAGCRERALPDPQHDQFDDPGPEQERSGDYRDGAETADDTRRDQRRTAADHRECCSPEMPHVVSTFVMERNP
jgi:hypothetical protein